MPETALPTVDDLLEYLALDAANYPLEQAQAAYDAALDAQFARCVTDPYTSSLAEALLRRGQRVLAARGAALGVTDLGQFGAQPLLRWDAMIDELEADYRKGGFA
jgi:hypothetical protein